jgi:hypothetical protein
MSLLLDVQGRRITGMVDASSPVASAIDGIVMAQAAEPTEGLTGPASGQALDAARLLRGADALRRLSTPAAAQAQAGAHAKPLAGAA